MMKSLRQHAANPVSGASLGVFRAAFGGLVFFEMLRYWVAGIHRDTLLIPKFHFKYAGFEWLEPLPEPAIYGGDGDHAVLVPVGLGGKCGPKEKPRRAARALFGVFVVGELPNQFVSKTFLVIVPWLVDQRI